MHAQTTTAHVLIAAVGMSALLLGCTSAESDSRPAVDPIEGVAAFLHSFLEAIDNRDTIRIRDTYVDDGRFVWIEDGEVRYHSAEEIVASLGIFPADSPIRTELTDLTVVSIGGTAAHAWATFTTSVGVGSESVSFRGAISFLTERVNGSWKLVAGHTSTP